MEQYICPDLMGETVGAPVLLSTMKKRETNGDSQAELEGPIQSTPTSTDWTKFIGQKMECYSGLPASLCGVQCFRSVKMSVSPLCKNLCGSKLLIVLKKIKSLTQSFV